MTEPVGPGAASLRDPPPGGRVPSAPSFAPTARPPRAWRIATLALLATCLVPVAHWTYAVWTEGLLGGGAAGLLALPMAALLAWLATRLKRPAGDDRPGAEWLLLVCAVGILAVFMLASTHRDLLVVAGVLLPPALFAWLWAHLGWPGARIFLFPLSFCLFALPWEHFLRGWLDTPMQAWSAEIAALLLNLAGYGVRIWTEVTIYTDQFYVIVNETCSGMNMLVTLSMYTLVFGWVAQPRLRYRIYLILLVFPLAMLANGVRVAIIYLLGHYGGMPLADGFWHTGSAYIIFLPVFWFLYVVNGALMRRSA